MHLYFITRGVKHFRDLFVNMMQSQMWRWKRTNLETNKKEVTGVQGALRPIELWEYIFPEECLDEVLTMLNIRNGDIINMSKTKSAMLRKALGKDVKPIPKYKDNPTHFVEKTGIAIYPIGIKKDPRKDFDFGLAGKWNQEGL